MHRKSIILIQLIIAICSFLSCNRKKIESLNLIYNQTDNVLSAEKLNVDIVYDKKNIEIKLRSVQNDSLYIRSIDLIGKSDGYYIEFNDLIYDEFKVLDNKPFLTLEEKFDYKIGVSALDNVKYDSYNYKIDDDLYVKVVTMYPIPSFFFKLIYNSDYEILALEYHGGYQKYYLESEEYSEEKPKYTQIQNKYISSQFVTSIREDSIKFSQKYDKWW
ncbi:hypothetical protein C8P70_11737 [Myroides indicus]|uniref:Uncharacterized protein n=1 Tax=Myroides indicus TaxID=1323422 RepID=A0A4R7EV09_9FLAO|nr:hypothetical protein C8P70_11737 [Myroides indicus]